MIAHICRLVVDRKTAVKLQFAILTCLSGAFSFFTMRVASSEVAEQFGAVVTAIENFDRQISFGF